MEKIDASALSEVLGAELSSLEDLTSVSGGTGSREICYAACQTEAARDLANGLAPATVQSNFEECKARCDG